ncbi:MAG: undecaprenyldiphospho-muramoylpentapeptide beta-N-acetylglucosaminyltransferase, partial [Rhodospirillales bacterium]|nr:undecaprenyldiphospho-muramoylpentapeptide beta-N-acetylglucosaminyltransferase [Rhodospirillales bacterium]
MRGPAVKPMVIAAGGTGGHVFPAEALAAELIRRGRRVALITDARMAEQPHSVFAGQERFVIAGAGIAGRGIVRAGRAALALGLGVVQARGILRRLDASVVVGFGGYPSVAPVLAARLAGAIPVVLHEQNAVLGRANRFLAPRARLLALSLPGTTRVPAGVTTEITGNPVRPAIAALAAQPYVAPDAAGKFRLLILGGSLGARVFSTVVPEALAGLPCPLRGRIEVVAQCRAEDLEAARAAYGRAGVTALLSPFFTDIPARLAAAHLVIARAGASTVAELAAAGRPAILVPLPGAIDGHQMGNAQSLAAAGAAEAVAQADFTAATLAERLTALANAPGVLSAR